MKKKSWVGYHKVNTELYLGLPVILEGVIKISEAIKKVEVNNDDIDRANMVYAKDYKIQKDIELIFKAFNKLGQ